MTRPSGKGKNLCFDSENKGFVGDVKIPTDMHIIHVMDADTEQHYRFFDDYEDRIPQVHLGEWETLKDGTIEDGLKMLAEAHCVIIQNGSGYDFHVFEKTYPEIFKGFNYFQKNKSVEYPYRVMDTYTMSCTLNPERKPPREAFLIGMGNVGPHSIAAHGIRIGRHKPDHTDWTQLTLPMMHRVEEDVEIGLDFFRFLMKEWYQQQRRPNGRSGYDISHAYYCELRVAFAVARQAIRGVRFDTSLALELVEEMDAELSKTEKEFRPHMPKRLPVEKAKYSAAAIKSMSLHLSEEDLSTIMDCTHRGKKATVWSLTNKPTKQGHKVSSAVTKVYPEMVGYMETYSEGDNLWKKALVGGPFTPVEFEDYPLGNRGVVKEILYKRGWRGISFNDKELEHQSEYYELLHKGKKKLAEEYGEFPTLWAGKIDEKSIERWKRNAAIAHGWSEEEECAGGLDKYVEDNKLVPSWALGIARWYIIKSRRTQILNIDDPVDFLEKGQWTSRAGSRICRGLLPRAICQDTGITAQEYFEKHNMWPDTGHWRIPAIAFHAATNTFRMRHRNVVNIPSRGLYGPHMRRLFIAALGKKIVGCDGAGLELRMLAHFMNSPEYTDIILNGDIHTYNQHKANLPLRDMAKTFIYAFLYGSGIPNLARVCGVDEKTMARCIAEFRNSLPALDNLINSVQNAAEKRGGLSAIDGRLGRVRSRGGKVAVHTALNVLLQMTGSIVMKWGHIIAEDLALERGLIKNVGDFPMLIHMHDEAQMEELETVIEEYEYSIHESEWDDEEKREYIDEKGQWSAASILEKEGDTYHLIRYFSPLGACYADGIRLAGEKFGLRCPTAGEYKVGNNWYDCH